jgi:cytochrome P450
VTRLRYPDGHLGWLVTGYAEARSVLSDARFSADSRYKRIPVHRPGADPFIGRAALPGWFVDLDPPQHTRFRRVLAGRFSLRQVQALRTEIEQIVEEQLDELARIGSPADLVTTLALPVPTRSICTFLGIPYADHAEFQAHSETLFGLEVSAADAEAAMSALTAYLLDLIATSRAESGTLIADLVASGEFTDLELAGVCVLLLTAGHETVAGMTSLAVLAAIRTPAAAASFARPDGPHAAVVEELLRYLTIFQFGVPRTPLEDVHLAGVTLQRGESVTVSLPAANRDPLRFPDPDRLDHTRQARGHLAFGFGLHQCIGQNLARLELEVVLSRLWQRFPGLALAVPIDELRFHDDVGFYGVHELPVRWAS